MKFPTPLTEGIFLKRYKRFFADVKQGSKTLTTHTPNTGSLKNCLTEGAPCRWSTSKDPHRKLPYTLEMIKAGRHWVGVNTHKSNHLVREVFEKGKVSHWKKFNCIKGEVKINEKTRIDFALWKNDQFFDPKKKIPVEAFEATKQKQLLKKDIKTPFHPFHFVEVKNVTLVEKSVARFPDAVTTRGQKHLKELMELIDQGHTAEIVFTVQHGGAKKFGPATDIDPEYARLLKESQKKGVRITPLMCSVGKTEIKIDPTKKLPLVWK